MSNYPTNSKLKYVEPKSLENSNWHYIGDGQLHDPSVNSPSMVGRWTINYNANNGKSFDKFQENLGNKNG
jgi:hypothetical protein